MTVDAQRKCIFQHMYKNRAIPVSLHSSHSLQSWGYLFLGTALQWYDLSSIKDLTISSLLPCLSLTKSQILLKSNMFQCNRTHANMYCGL